MFLCVGICPKDRDSNGNPMKKKGGRSRKRQREEGHLILPRLASSLPPRRNILESVSWCKVCSWRNREAASLAVACGRSLSLSGTWVPHLYGQETSLMGSWTPLLLTGSLCFFRRAAGTSEIPEEEQRLCVEEACGPFLSLVHKREGRRCSLQRLGQWGDRSRQPASPSYTLPSAHLNPQLFWSQRTSSRSSVGTLES